MHAPESEVTRWREPVTAIANRRTPIKIANSCQKKTFSLLSYLKIVTYIVYPYSIFFLIYFQECEMKVEEIIDN